MIDLLMSPSFDSAILLTACFVGGLASTMVGTSGGFTFAAMASVLPVSVVVPIHAIVEAFGSLVRCVMLRQYVQWRFFLMFLLFGCAGVVLAIPLIGKLPDTILRFALGIFILIVTWIPLGDVLRSTVHASARIGGLVTSFLTVFVGATGPLVAALLSRRFSSHPEVIATHAACMFAQHIAKVVIFVSIGWTLATYTYEVVGMILVTALGTWIGRHIIVAVRKALLTRALKVTVTLLAMHITGAAVVQLTSAPPARPAIDHLSTPHENQEEDLTITPPFLASSHQKHLPDTNFLAEQADTALVTALVASESQPIRTRPTNNMRLTNISFVSGKSDIPLVGQKLLMNAVSELDQLRPRAIVIFSPPSRPTSEQSYQHLANRRIDNVLKFMKKLGISTEIIPGTRTEEGEIGRNHQRQTAPEQISIVAIDVPKVKGSMVSVNREKRSSGFF